MESGSDISQALRLEIAYYFGSLRNAKIAVKTDAKLLSGWSMSKIITVLGQMHRSKEKLNYATGRLPINHKLACGSIVAFPTISDLTVA